MIARFLIILLLPLSAAAAETNTVSKPVNDFEAFKIIAQRNIFDPNRSARLGSRSENRDVSKPRRVDSFSLVGTMLYEKGQFAFFESSSSEYRKVLKAGDSIAGYKVNEVASAGVKLEGKDKKLDLAVGQRMQREEDGDWTVSGRPAGETASKAAGSDSSSSSASGDDDEVIKRLMKKREEEMNK